jgi:tetratricopeptide (TPR) repeat protein
MRRQVPFHAAVLALALACGPAFSAPLPPFAEIATALSSGNGAGALRLADAALGQAGLSQADHARLLADRGFARNLQGDKQKAVADLTQAINAHSLPNPEQARIYLERGMILDAMNRLDDAVGDYSAVLRLTPAAAAQALNNRANVFRRQSRFQEARRDYLAALASNNVAAEYPYYGLGQIAEKEGKTDEARYFYSRAVDANSGYTLAVDRLAALGGAATPSQPVPKPPKSTGAAKTPADSRPPVRRSASLSPTIAVVQPDLRPAMDNSGRKTGGAQVQLGAWHEQAQAAKAWKQAVKDAGGVLSGFSPHILPIDLPGKGRFYRLRVEVSDARQLCAALKSKGMTCVPVRD